MKEIIIKNKKICSGGLPLVCVSLMGETIEEIKSNLYDILYEAKANRIDIIEFRGDYFRDLEDDVKLAEALEFISTKASDKIILFTIRSPREGGVNRDYGNKSIEAINKYVIDNALADMVDMELFSVGKDSILLQLAKHRGVKIVMSNHDFEKTPSKEELINRLSRMQQLGADVAKIAVMPHSEDDLLCLLQATLAMKHSNTPVVTMSMGINGALSRATGEIFGSAITFASVGEASAPGQIPIKELNEILDSIHSYCVSD